MKLLIITHSYKPDLTPRAFRWASIVEYWATQGHQIDVICAWKPGAPKNEIWGNVRIYRAGSNFISFLGDKFRESKLKTSVDGQFTQYKKRLNLKKKLKALIKVLYNLTWKKIYWPDSVCFWYFPAMAIIKRLIKREKYHGIISVSHPFTGHLAGLRLKSLNPSLFWLADIGDPFCFLNETPTNNHRLYQRLNYNIERKIFNRADVVTVTNGPTLRKYVNIFPETRDKIHIIPPVTFISEKKCPNQEFISKDQKIRLVYTGTLYKKIRNPEIVLLLFKKLLQTSLGDRIEFHFYGEVNDCEEYFKPYRTLLGAKLFVNGVVARDKIFKVIQTADILVNIGNSTSYQLSSKAAEYISTGKPILNIVSNPDDCSLEFFSKYPAVFNFTINNKLIDVAQFENLCNFIEHLPPPVDDHTLKTLLRPFQVDTIAQAYKNLFNFD